MCISLMNQSAMHIHVFLFLYAFDHVHAAVDRTTAVETIEIICQQKREDTIACRASLHACLTSRHGMQQQETSFACCFFFIII